MTKARHLIFAAILGLGLTGCSYFDAPPPTGDDALVDAMNHNLKGASVQTGEGDRLFARPIYPHEYAVMQSNSSVEVYSLEGDGGWLDRSPVSRDPVLREQRLQQGEVPQAEEGDRVQWNAPQAIRQNGVIAGDPSVEVFPLDGSYSARSSVLTPAPRSSEPEMPYRESGVSDAEALNRAMFYFAHNSSGVKSEDMGKLYDLAEVYRAQSVAGFSVEGHASERSTLPDPVARQVANLKMSMNRAYAVAKVLMENGVDGDDIVVKAYGAAKSTGEESSRRVDVRPLYN